MNEDSAPLLSDIMAKRAQERRALWRNRWIAFAATLSLHSLVLWGITVANTKDKSEISFGDMMIMSVESVQDQTPETPKPEKTNEENDYEDETESDTSLSSTASLPEPPSSLSLEAVMTQAIRTTPPIPPKPGAVGITTLPVKRSVAGGKDKYKNVFTIDQLDKKPDLRFSPSPEFPKVLKQRNQSGSVMALYVVGPKGNVEDVVVESTTHPLFAEAVRAAVMKWKWTPGRKKGKAVTFKVRQEFPFKINAGDR